MQKQKTPQMACGVETNDCHFADTLCSSIESKTWRIFIMKRLLSLWVHRRMIYLRSLMEFQPLAKSSVWAMGKLTSLLHSRWDIIVCVVLGFFKFCTLPHIFFYLQPPHCNPWLWMWSAPLSSPAEKGHHRKNPLGVILALHLWRSIKDVVLSSRWCPPGRLLGGARLSLWAFDPRVRTFRSLVWGLRVPQMERDIMRLSSGKRMRHAASGRFNSTPRHGDIVICRHFVLKPFLGLAACTMW